MNYELKYNDEMRMAFAWYVRDYMGKAEEQAMFQALLECERVIKKLQHGDFVGMVDCLDYIKNHLNTVDMTKKLTLEQVVNKSETESIIKFKEACKQIYGS